MTTDIKQIDFILCNHKGKGKTVAGGDADCLHTFVLAAKVMVSKERLERILPCHSLYNPSMPNNFFRFSLTASWSLVASPPIFLIIRRLSRVKSFILTLDGAGKPAF